jgi:hypothetical protein
VKTKKFELTIQESAVIAAECSLSLSDNRCDRPESRTILEQIIAKMAEPFGFDLHQLRAISDAIAESKRVHIN